MRSRRTSRRDFMKAGATGLASATLFTRASQGPLSGLQSATPADLQNLIGDGRRRRIVLCGGVVLSLDPKVGDLEKGDVLIDGKTIAQIAPTISATDAEVVDCSGTIVMPGFITTHHHQYETIQPSIIAARSLRGSLAPEALRSGVQNIWTAGPITDPSDPNKIIWDLGRVSYDP